jgi:1-deoxy-D-xylulose-5-phosphate synthase
MGVPLLAPEAITPVEIGRGETLRIGDGGRVALLAYGSGVAKALEAADLLESAHGIRATVADARFAKPIDVALAAQLARDHELLVTVEEGVLAGGFGSAVWEALNEGQHRYGRIVRVGLPDRYVTHGKPALLHAEVGFTGKAIVQRVVDALAGADAPTSPLTA